MREHHPPRRARNASRSNKCTSCSFFNSAPYSGGMTKLLLVAAQRLDRQILHHQQLQPVQQFRGGRLLLQPGHLAHLEEHVHRLARQVLANVGIVRLHDPLHRVAVGEADVMEEAAAQERVRQLLLVVRRDDDDRPMLRHHRLAASRRRRTASDRVPAADRWETRCRPCPPRRSAPPPARRPRTRPTACRARCSWRCRAPADRQAARRAGATPRRIRTAPAAPWWWT